MSGYERNNPRHPLAGPNEPMGFAVQMTKQEIDDVLHAIAFYHPDRFEAPETFKRRYRAFRTFQAQIETQLTRIGD